MITASTTKIYSDHWGRLIEITNKSPYKVTVQTSDKQGEIVLANGSRPVIQNIEFDIKTIRSMNLVVPERGWDDDATIHVRVYKNDTIISQADITDRNGHIYIHDRHNNSDIFTLDKYYCSVKDDRGFCDYKERGGGADENFKLAVDAQGNIVFNL